MKRQGNSPIGIYTGNNRIVSPGVVQVLAEVVTGDFRGGSGCLCQPGTGKPTQNVCIERANDILRDELSNETLFAPLHHVRAVEDRCPALGGSHRCYPSRRKMSPALVFLVRQSRWRAEPERMLLDGKSVTDISLRAMPPSRPDFVSAQPLRSEYRSKRWLTASFDKPRPRSTLMPFRFIRSGEINQRWFEIVC